LNAKAGQQIATKFGNCFTKLYDRLASHPESGPPRPAIGPNTRIGIVAPYIVIYRLGANASPIRTQWLKKGDVKIPERLARPRFTTPYYAQFLE
jgi:toxin ParE1/3/4